MKINRNVLIASLLIFVIVLLVLNIIVIHEASFINKKDETKLTNISIKNQVKKKENHQKKDEVIKPF